jgi:hypothetical protein
MTDSPNLGLPYLEASQAQKHVTHNEALRRLDALVQAVVLDRTLTAPPATPANGDSYLPAAGATGAWAGHALEIASWQDGAWAFFPPAEGWRVWSAAEDALLAWTGTAWIVVGGAALLNPAALVGVNATADTTNRLAVSSAAVLLNHAGAGHQLKINKNAATDTASLLFQTGFSGRAEMGTTGDDDYHFKVSADGSAWNDAISINRSTGEVSFPNTSFPGGANLTFSRTSTTVTVISDTGTDAVLPAADSTNAGVMLSADKVKLDAITGTNTGDQNLFSTIAVSGQSNVVADTTGDTLTLIAGTNVTITTNATNDEITISSSGGGGLSDGDKGDITVSSSGTVWTIDNDVVTFAKMQNIATDRLLGRDTAASGDVEEITVGGGIEFTGFGGIQTSAFTGDVTKSAGGTALTIADDAVTDAKLRNSAANSVIGRASSSSGDPADISTSTDGHVLRLSGTTLGFGTVATAGITDDAITFAKLQNIATDRLLGRDTAATGDVEEISLDATLDFTGSGSIQRAALTGDVTASAGSNATTIANDAVSDAKLRDSAALSVIGRSANSTGDPADIAAASDGQVLRRSGTTLGFGAVDLASANAITGDLPFANLTQGAARSVLGVTGNATADVASIQGTADQVLVVNGAGTALAFGTVATGGIANDAVTFAKMQNIASDRLLGRDTASSGDPEELTVGGGIEFTGSAGIQTSAFTGDVTKAAGGTALTITNDAVTYAKLQNVAANSVLARAAATSGDVGEVALAASQLLGRGSTGDVAAITLGTNLSMSGTTLNASGGGGNTFQTIAVSGQSDVVADSSTDTLTLVAGSNITITTNASNDEITITAASASAAVAADPIIDGAYETTTTTGTGNITLAGAVTNYQTINAVIGTNVYFTYAIRGTGTEWETGVGYLSNSTTLVRERPIEGSAGDETLVNFSAGTKNVFITATGFGLRAFPIGSMLAQINGFVVR